MITELQKSYILDLRKRLEELDKNNELLKVDFEKMNKSEASEYIDNLLEEIKKLRFEQKKKVFEDVVKIKCKRCGYTTTFIGTEEIARKYWICSCGSSEFEVIK
ncbi:MAG: hypothetical protein QXL14_03360 [Candidatus Aenigmatarchaeota archaeon]